VEDRSGARGPAERGHAKRPNAQLGAWLGLAPCCPVTVQQIGAGRDKGAAAAVIRISQAATRAGDSPGIIRTGLPAHQCPLARPAPAAWPQLPGLAFELPCPVPVRRIDARPHRPGRAHAGRDQVTGSLAAGPNTERRGNSSSRLSAGRGIWWSTFRPLRSSGIAGVRPLPKVDPPATVAERAPLLAIAVAGRAGEPASAVAERAGCPATSPTERAGRACPLAAP